MKKYILKIKQAGMKNGRKEESQLEMKINWKKRKWFWIMKDEWNKG